MLKHFNWRVVIGIILVALSAIVYMIHCFVFRDAHHIFIYLVGDIAFVLFEVLLVILIIDQFLHEREKQALLAMRTNPFDLNVSVEVSEEVA
jgi:hypothetical protein